MYNTKKKERERKKDFFIHFAAMSDLSFTYRLDQDLCMVNGNINYHLSFILCADERRRFDDDERERFLRSFGTEF
jgi:hypothetical protein